MNIIKNAFTPVRQMFAAVAIFALVLSLAYGAFPVAHATVQDKVKICHYTPNGFVANEPSKTADAGGHAGHMDGKDIIPPFDYPEQGNTPAGHFDGQNWDAEGQEIYNDGLCNGGPQLELCEDDSAENYGEELPCVYSGTLQVVKVVVGSDADESTFSFQVNGGASTAFETDGQNDLTLSPGSYDVTEVATPGYTTTYNNCDNAVVTEEGTTVCTITNTWVSVMCDDPEALNYEEEGECEYPTEDIDNSCLIPSTEGDITVFDIGASIPPEEKSVQTMFNENGFGGVDVEADQKNYQVWDFESVSTDEVSFNVTILGGVSGNVQTFGYYKAGDTSSFVPLFTIPPTAVGTTFPVTIPDSFATSFGFAIQTTGTQPNTWYSEKALNTDGKDNVAAYNPADNVYLLAFEDLKAYDNDYNDLVVKVSKIKCTENEVAICQTDANLLANGSFETPEVSDPAKWDIFSAGTSWTTTWVDGAILTTPQLELHRGVNGWLPFVGEQYAELDSDQGGPSSNVTGEPASVRIAQTVATIPGATYELSYRFSPRPDSVSATENVLKSYIDGVLDTVTGDGSAMTNTEWELHSRTFTADASTDIAFEDGGTSNSVGTFLDDVCLIKIADPEPEVCEVTIVSDTNTTVVEKDGAFAKLLSFVHPGWTAAITGASWIWGDDPVAPPVNGVSQTFERKFGWNGPVTSATLYIAADNTFDAEINGSTAGTDLTEFNYKAPAKSYDVTSLINDGNNEIVIEVGNLPSSSDPAANPAGLLYKLVVTGTDAECDVPYEEEETYIIDGYKWNDENPDGEWDEEVEDGIQGWVIKVTNGEDTLSTTTDSTGYYWFEVPAGTWTVSEIQQSGWTQTAPVGNTCVYSFGMIYYKTVLLDTPDCSNFGNHQTNEDPGLSCSLNASKNPVSNGEDFDLIWTTTGADHVELDGVDVALDGSQSTELFDDTTYTLTAWANESEEEVIECEVTVTKKTSGGGGGRRSSSSSSSSNNDEPEPEVLGEEISIMPLGAANTGAGGTSSESTLPFAFALIGVLASLATIRATKKNG